MKYSRSSPCDHSRKKLATSSSYDKAVGLCNPAVTVKLIFTRSTNLYFYKGYVEFFTKIEPTILDKSPWESKAIIRDFL